MAAPDSRPTGGGGGTYGQAVPETKPRNPARRKRRPGRRRGATLLTSFELLRAHLYLDGRAARVNFTLTGRRRVPVRLHVLRAADRERVATIDLGMLGAGAHSIPFTGDEAGPLPEGSYLLHLTGRGLRRGASASSTATLEFSHHRFPLSGSFDWGGGDARFGAKRDGHRHQGQDLSAAQGTPVVAPRGGLVETV